MTKSYSVRYIAALTAILFFGFSKICFIELSKHVLTRKRQLQLVSIFPRMASVQALFVVSARDQSNAHRTSQVPMKWIELN